MSILDSSEPLPPFLGEDFEHPIMASMFELPRRFADIDPANPRQRELWLHFLVFYFPVYREQRRAQAREWNAVSEVEKMLVTMGFHIEQIRETLRQRAKGYDDFHWEEKLAWPARWDKFDRAGNYTGPKMSPGRRLPDGTREWRVPAFVGHNFRCEWMAFFGLPLSYPEINWRDPRSEPKWKRFFVWFYPAWTQIVLAHPEFGPEFRAFLPKLDQIEATFRSELKRFSWMPRETVPPLLRELEGPPDFGG